MAKEKKKLGLLGKGLAENARKKLKGRGQSIEDQINAAMGITPRTQKKKK